MRRVQPEIGGFLVGFAAPTFFHSTRDVCFAILIGTIGFVWGMNS